MPKVAHAGAVFAPRPASMAPCCCWPPVQTPCGVNEIRAASSNDHLALSPEGLRQESARRHALCGVGPQESLSHSCCHRCLQGTGGLLAGAGWGPLPRSRTSAAAESCRGTRREGAVTDGSTPAVARLLCHSAFFVMSECCWRTPLSGTSSHTRGSGCAPQCSGPHSRSGC